MASGPITSWETDGETVETVSDFIFWAPESLQKMIAAIKLKNAYSLEETPVLWPPHAKSWLIGKDSDAGRDWGQEEKGTTEDEMVGWHHWLNGCESEWTLGVGDGQGGLVCFDSWGRKESDTTEWLNWNEHAKVESR